MSPTVRCQNCGIEFTIFPSRLGRTHFCSTACRVTWRRSENGTAARFWAKVDKSGGPDSCWHWLGHKDRGYGALSVGAPPNRRMVRAHRIAYTLTHGPIPGHLLVCHHCDNPSCVNPAHLFLGTIADNTRDMDRKGRRRNPDRAGERNGNARLTAAAVAEIRDRYAKGERQTSLGMAFGVSQRAISMIVRREHWP